MFNFEPRAPIIAMMIACCFIPIVHIVGIRLSKKFGETLMPILVSYLFCLGFWISWFIINLRASYNLEVFEITTSLLSPLLIYLTAGLLYLEFFSLLNRGYSLSILVEIWRRESAPTEQDLINEYGGGKGLRWMLTKRLNGIEKLCLVSVTNGHIKLLSGVPKMFVLFLNLGKRMFSIKNSG